METPPNACARARRRGGSDQVNRTGTRGPPEGTEAHTKNRLLESRAQATEALDAFIGYVEITATTPERRERAEAILAPVTRLLLARRRAGGVAEVEPAPSPQATGASAISQLQCD